MLAAHQAYVDAVLAKCEALMSAGLWAPEPAVRPRKWLANFPEDDRTAAAILLDSFVYFSERSTRRLLVGAFEAALRIPLGRPRALVAPSLERALFTPVLGENPNPTDSGYQISRAVRQALSVDENRFVDLTEALASAQRGELVVFLDDVTMSGDQFMRTWDRSTPSGASFQSVSQTKALPVAYICICATDAAMLRIQTGAPGVRVYPTHLLDASQTYRAIPSRQPPPLVQNAMPMVEALLDKFSAGLQFRPDDQYMLNDATWQRDGYKGRALLLAFEHSVPDGTLPILWADGPPGWTPLVRRA